MSRDFPALLTKNKIKHETSAPYSPHQNGTVEIGWRTLYDMSRCLLIESELPVGMGGSILKYRYFLYWRCIKNINSHIEASILSVIYLFFVILGYFNNSRLPYIIEIFT